MHRLLRGPFGRLAEALPEARYEVVQALLRTSLCLTSALALLTVGTSSLLVAPAVVNLCIASASLIAAMLLARVTSVEQARLCGRWSTLADVLVVVGYAVAFHDRPGAGGLYAVFVLLIGPLRYGLRGLPLTVLPVAGMSILWPQLDQFGGHIEADQVVLLCLAFSFPAIAVRAVLLRGTGQLRQAEQMLVHHAAHDPLTQLANRQLALGVLETALEAGEAVAVLFLDLDRFKVVNDAMGHAEGDLLLVQVATRLRAVMRGGDLVGRLGADEFVMLCRDADAGVAQRVAARVLEALCAPMVTTGGLELVVGTSIGIALGGAGDSGDQLLADADAAMYAAKAAGGGRARLFSVDLRRAMVRRHELEVDLRAAVRAGGLWAVYQPMYDLVTGVVTGCEALCRWRDERWGVVSPEEFIAVAEQSDLILELGDWVLQQALNDAFAWPLSSAGYPLSVSINVSLRQLRSAGFATRVQTMITASGVEPSRVCLEVTETMLGGEVEPIVVVLEALRGIGVRLSIDDFGTGHASLTYLARFPVDQVKVDQSFVAGLGCDAGSAAIVGGVIAMSHTFDLRVVAEGVETASQLELLRTMRCDAVQGFLLSVPLSQHDLLRLLTRSSPEVHVPAPRPPDSVPDDLHQEPRLHQLLVEGARDVTGSRDLESVLERGLRALSRCMRFTGGAILLIEADQVRIAAAMPTPTAEALAGRIPLGQGVSGTIALTGEPRYLPDITIASTVTAGRRKYASGGVRSWYGVPLISAGHPVGVLQIDSTEVDAFDQEARLAVLAFAPVVALAVVCAQAAERDLVPGA